MGGEIFEARILINRHGDRRMFSLRNKRNTRC